MKVECAGPKLSFQSGLTSKILLAERFTNISCQEKYLAKNFGTMAYFRNNRSVALANRYCTSIFDAIAKKIDMEYTAPPVITVHKKNELPVPYVSFCLPESKFVLKDNLPYPARSIFFKDYRNFSQINAITEELYEQERTSSPHFMAPFIHEWVHSLHLDLMFQKGLRPGDIQDIQLRDYEKDIIADNIGSYCVSKSGNCAFEIVGEMFTKTICDSLSKDCRHLDKNPIDILKSMPREFLEIFDKVMKVFEF